MGGCADGYVIAFDFGLKHIGVAIGQSLNLKVIAEGVEDGKQLEFLRDRKCDEIQGSIFSPPLPAAEFESLVREGRHL